MTPALSTPAKTVLHALRKGVCAVLIAAFDLVCFLRPLPLCGGVMGSAQTKCARGCTAVGTKAPPCGLPINRSAERCRPAARGAAG